MGHRDQSPRWKLKTHHTEHNSAPQWLYCVTAGPFIWWTRVNARVNPFRCDKCATLVKEQSWTFANYTLYFEQNMSDWLVYIQSGCIHWREARERFQHNHISAWGYSGMFVWFYYFILGGSNINQQLAVLFWVSFLVHLTLGCATSSGRAGWVGSTGEMWIKQRQCATRAQVFASTQSRDWATSRQSWTHAGQVFVCSDENFLLKIYSVDCESSPMLAHWSGTFINSKKNNHYKKKQSCKVMNILA